MITGFPVLDSLVVLCSIGVISGGQALEARKLLHESQFDGAGGAVSLLADDHLSHTGLL